MSEISEDFEKVAEQINQKIAEAAAALEEANDLATKAGLTSLISSQWVLDDMNVSEREAFRKKIKLIDVSDLECELESAGWNTSSSYC
jgi:enamine deaminase RidA (YjgF/YER057c/UK114 family)